MIDELSKAFSKQWMVVHNHDFYFVAAHEGVKFESTDFFNGSMGKDRASGGSKEASFARTATRLQKNEEDST
jgi:hypothetical protein